VIWVSHGNLRQSEKGKDLLLRCGGILRKQSGPSIKNLGGLENTLLRKRKIRFFYIPDNILDFYLKKCRLAIEVDGPNHSSGRQHRYDEKRDRRLAAVGIKTLRFTNEEVLRNPVTVVDLIYKEVATRFIPKQKRGGKRRKTNRGRIG